LRDLDHKNRSSASEHKLYSADKAGWLPYRFAIACLFTSALLQLFVGARYVYFLLRYGELTLTSGSEELNVYTLGKMQAGLPLYQATNEAPFAFTPYNFGFYRLYRLVLDLLGAHQDSIFIEGRWITFAFALLAVILFYVAARLLVSTNCKAPSRVELFIILTIGWLAFVGHNYTGAWAWTIRPDLPALAFEIAGLVAFLLGMQRIDLWALGLSSCLFAIGWSLKQTAVWIFFSIAIWLLFSVVRTAIRTRRLVTPELTRLLVFTAPMTMTMLLALTFLGYEYRYNTIFAQSINSLSLDNFAITLPSVLGNVFLFFFFLLVIAVQVLKKNSPSPSLLLGGLWRVMVPLVAIVNFLQSVREGSAKNQLYEILFIAALLGAVQLVRVGRSASWRSGLASYGAAILLTPLLLTSLVMALTPNRIGIQIPATAETLKQQRRLVRWYTQQPGPRFSTYGVLALPWYATDDHYPTFVMLDFYFVRAQEWGLLPPDYLIKAAKRPRIVVLNEMDHPSLKTQLIASGYQEIPLPEKVGNAPLVIYRAPL
jgi:hypothetical protein